MKIEQVIYHKITTENGDSVTLDDNEVKHLIQLLAKYVSKDKSK